MTVAVTRYAEPDDIVRRCLESLAAQDDATRLDVLMLDQQQSEPVKTMCDDLSNDVVTFHYSPIEARSLSYARNQGIARSQHARVLFCDIDCTFAANWASEVEQTFDDTGAAIVGTKIMPVWPSRPRWYQHSRYIQEFYSMIDLGSDRREVSKIVGASFAMDKRLLKANAYFDESLGRRGGRLLGGEETDLCDRVIAGGGKVLYTPNTYALHWVEPERMKLSWLVRRAYFGGVSRGVKGGGVKAFNTRPNLRDYAALMIVAPAYLMGRWRARKVTAE